MNRSEYEEQDLIARIPGTEEYVIREHMLDLRVTVAGAGTETGTDAGTEAENTDYVLRRKITCTGMNLIELVYGYLCGEGLIGSADDVAEVGFDPDSTRADVVITGRASGTGDTEAGATGSEAGAKHRSVDVSAYAPDITDAQIYHLAQVFGDHEGIHTYTSASHLAILARGDDILCIMEDISRHCAIDKVIGHALLSGVDLSECMIYSSGRVQYDTVNKLVHAGVPVLISKATPTYDAMSLARDNRITVIGRAWPDGYQVFT